MVDKARFDLMFLPPDLLKVLFEDFLEWKDLRQLDTAINVNDSVLNTALLTKWNVCSWDKQVWGDSACFLLWLEKRDVYFRELSLARDIPVIHSDPESMVQKQLQTLQSLQWFKLPAGNAVYVKPFFALCPNLISLSIHAENIDMESLFASVSNNCLRLQSIKLYSLEQAWQWHGKISHLGRILAFCKDLQSLYLWNFQVSRKDIKSVLQLKLRYILGGLTWEDGLTNNNKLHRVGVSTCAHLSKHGWTQKQNIFSNVASTHVYEFLAAYDTPLGHLAIADSWSCAGIDRLFQRCRLISQVQLRNCTDLTESDFVLLLQLPCLKSIELSRNSTIQAHLPLTLVSYVKVITLVAFSAIGEEGMACLARSCPHATLNIQ